jgi:hypothetical protein
MRVQDIDPEETGTWAMQTIAGTAAVLSVPPDTRASWAESDPRAGGCPRHTAGPAPRSHPHPRVEVVVAFCSYDLLDGIIPGIHVGECAVVLLEPMGSDGRTQAVVTAPVASIERLR